MKEIDDRSIEQQISELDFLIAYLKISLNSSVLSKEEFYQLREKRYSFKIEKHSLLKKKERRDKLEKINRIFYSE